jgi:SAM-dependent methyltransferase
MSDVLVMTKWDDQYRKGQGLRWWPEGELVRFCGRHYGVTPLHHPPPSLGAALDLGCGTGRHVWLLNSMGFNVTGVDVSADALQLARLYTAVRGVDYFVGLCMLLPDLSPLPAAHFDLVVDCQTIQHLSLEDHVVVYREIARVLKPGGRFWTMHVGKGSYDTVYEGKYPELREWEPEEIGDLHEQAGLVIETVPIVTARSEGKGPIAWHVIECRKK